MMTRAFPHTHGRAVMVVLILALALQALGGLLIPGLYRDSVWVTTAQRGSDITNLFVVIPLLIGLGVLIRRGSLWAQLASAGVYFFVWENTLYYLAGCAFNQLFLDYVAVSIASLSGLVLTLVHMDRTQVEQQTSPRMPRRAIALVLAAMAGILCVLWVGQCISSLISGKVPQILIDAGASTHLIAALDLSILAPLYLLGAVLLWQGRAWGTILSAGSLVQGLLVTIGLVATAPLQAAARLEGAWTMVPLWALMGVCFLVGAVLLLKSITRK